MKDLLAVYLRSHGWLRKDSPFSWLVCVCSILSHIFHIGYAFAVVGVLHQVHQTSPSLDIGEAESGWIVSIFLCVMFLGGPIASILVKKTSVRLVEILCGVCAILGHALCAQAKQSWQIFLLFSTICGFGFSCGYIASSEVLQYHFRRHIYLASAAVVGGTFTGICALPPAVQIILQNYGYHKGMGILSSVQITHLLVAVFYIETIEDDGKLKTEEITAENDKQKVIDSSNLTESSAGSSSQTDSQLEPLNTQVDKEIVSEGDCSCDCVSEETKAVKNGKASEDINLPSGNTSQSIIVQILTMLIQLKIWLYLLNVLLWNMGSTAFFALVSGYMIEEVGIDEQQAAVGMTINGGTAMVGVVLIASVSQLSFDRLIVQTLATTVFGMTIIIMVYSTILAHYYAGMVVFGISYGALISNLLSVSYDICGPDQMVLLFALALAFQSVGSLVGTPLCSLIGKNYGSKFGLIFSGSVCILASLLLVLPIVQNSRQKKQAEANAITTDTATVKYNAYEYEVVPVIDSDSQGQEKTTANSTA